jgi:hypothetical protein
MPERQTATEYGGCFGAGFLREIYPPFLTSVAEPRTRKDNPIKRNPWRASSGQSASMRDRACNSGQM